MNAMLLSNMLNRMVFVSTEQNYIVNLIFAYAVSIYALFVYLYIYIYIYMHRNIGESCDIFACQ